MVIADYTLESVAGMFIAEIKWPNYILRAESVLKCVLM